MDWNDLRVFLAVVRAGSLGAAGRSIGVSHPTIARRLQALEVAVGHKLLQRSADGFVPTAEGTAIIALAEQVEEATVAIERRLAGSETALEGTLRISASDWFGAWMLPPVLEAFGHRHPGVSVELLTATRIYSLAHREADLAFRVVPFDEGAVVQRRLLTLPFGVYAASEDTIDPTGAGAGLRIIEDVRTELHPDPGWLVRRYPEATVVLRSNSRTVQARMCAEGVGVALLPRAMAARVPGLRRIDLGEEPPARSVWMGYHPDLRGLRRLRAFADLASDLLTSVDGP